MRIEIVTKDEDYIADFEAESNPFKVGEIIDIHSKRMDNKNKVVEEFCKWFKIEEIRHFLEHEYNDSNFNYTYFQTTIEVSELT